MPTIVRERNVTEAELPGVIRDFEEDDPTPTVVSTKQTDGRYTVVATYPDAAAAGTG
jgi:hypothetical protein